MNRALLGSMALAAVVTAMPGLASDEIVEVAGIRARVIGPRVAPDPRTEPWGTTVAAVRTIHGLGFQESDSSTTFSYSNATTHRFRTGGPPWFDADLADLPAGARIVGMELEACDTNAAAEVTATLFGRDSAVNATFVVGSVATGAAGTPGCALFGSPGNLGNHWVDNGDFAYFVRAELGATDDTTSLGSVRIYYKLEVSLAPGFPTFGDVPTSHPFFRFIEALAASGITGGCGGGNYCPDSPLTRGQMAVFLATALGLHFPN